MCECAVESMSVGVIRGSVRGAQCAATRHIGPHLFTSEPVQLNSLSESAARQLLQGHEGHVHDPESKKKQDVCCLRSTLTLAADVTEEVKAEK